MEVKIKISANKVWDLNNFGDIKSDILTELFKDPEITKRNSNVVESIENMLYDGHQVTAIQYDALTSRAILHINSER